MAGLRDSKPGTTKAPIEREEQNPLLPAADAIHSRDWMSEQAKADFIHPCPNPRELGHFIQGRIFKVFTICLFPISLQPGGQLILIDANNVSSHI